MASEKAQFTVELMAFEPNRSGRFYARVREYGDQRFPSGSGDTPEAALAVARKWATDMLVHDYLNGVVAPVSVDPVLARWHWLASDRTSPAPPFAPKPKGST